MLRGPDELEPLKYHLGVEPHKTRGPCQCVEFLGLLLSNVEGARGISISRKRMTTVLTE